MVTQPKRAVLSQHEKSRKANRITQRLATLASEVSMKDFNSRLACLEEIAKIWEQGDHVSVECCDGVESIANDDDLSTVDALDEIANVEDHGANEHHDSDHDDTPDDISIAEENERSAARQDSTNEQSYEISLHDYPEVSQSVTMKQHIQTDPSDATTVVESLDCSGAIDISTVQLPSAMKKRGRPKGGDLTVVGLPKKKKAFNKPVAFLKMHPRDQERGGRVKLMESTC
ncbi:uncharacterized protein [Dysidea avara]|uniref:uncharacterized protein isoform X2 n=1 Tax=Dysidea avara TaxID=196820 RepID=UPI003333CA2B